MREVRESGRAVILVGDLNLAPEAQDCYWRSRLVDLGELERLAGTGPGEVASHVDPAAVEVARRVGRAVPRIREKLAKVRVVPGHRYARKEPCWMAVVPSNFSNEREIQIGSKGLSKGLLELQLCGKEVRVPDERTGDTYLCWAGHLTVEHLSDILEKALEMTFPKSEQKILSRYFTKSHESPCLVDFFRELIVVDGMVDTFREAYPEAQGRFTAFNQAVNGRFGNKGKRIDFILCDHLLYSEVVRSRDNVLPGGDTEAAAKRMATADGKFKAATADGDGLADHPIEVLDSQFAAPHNGIIYFPPKYSDHLGVSFVLNMQKASEAASASASSTAFFSKKRTAVTQPQRSTRDIRSFFKAAVSLLLLAVLLDSDLALLRSHQAAPPAVKPVGSGAGPSQPGKSKLLAPGDIPFAGLCQVLDAIKAAQANKRALHLQHFMTNYVERRSNDFFTIFRLLLPYMDRSRQMYNMKEQRLARALIEACGLTSGVSGDAKKLLSWRQGASSKHAGDLVCIAHDCLFVKHCGNSRGTSQLTLREFNGLLDKLSQAHELKDQAVVLRRLILNLSPGEMKWALRVILRVMHLGVGEKAILACLHPKAQELYNFTMNLKKVCETLCSPESILEMQVVRPGNVVRPQLAERVNSVALAFSKVKDEEFVVETKFDGERLQLHRQGSQLTYYARSGLDHGKHSGYNAMDEAFCAQLGWEDCVLDGEILILNKKTQKFLPFGTIKHVVNLINAEGSSGASRVTKLGGASEDAGAEEEDGEAEGEEPVRLRDLEVTFMAFDVLYTRHNGMAQSVIHLPLRERHALLAETVRPLSEGSSFEIKSKGATGRVICVLPGKGKFSQLGVNEESLQRQFDESISQQEEGIVIKLLSSEWVPASRSTNWLKVKPEYVTEVEVEGVVIGANYGTGRRGGILAQYLIGIPKSRGGSKYLLSFCRVGTGLSEQQKEQIHRKLQGNLVSDPPSMYRVTGQPGETPHVWVKDPEKSVILEVIGDVRTIPTTVYATGRSLRFPRTKRIRHDKGIHDLTSLEELEEIKPEHMIQRQKMKRGGAPGSKAQGRGLSVPEEYRAAARGGMEKKSDLLSGFLFYFANQGGRRGRVETAVLENGGEITKNFLKGYSGKRRLVCVADHLDWRAKSLVSQDVDVLSAGWVEACVERGEILEEYQPRHWYWLGSASRAKLRGHVDRHGDVYDEDLEPEDLRMLLSRPSSASEGAGENGGVGNAIAPELFPVLDEVLAVGGRGCAPKKDWELDQRRAREEARRRAEADIAEREAGARKRTAEEKEAAAAVKRRKEAEEERKREKQKAEEVDGLVDDLDDLIGSLI